MDSEEIVVNSVAEHSSAIKSEGERAASGAAQGETTTGASPLLGHPLRGQPAAGGYGGPEPLPKEGTGSERRDWVEEAYRCFIKDAADIDPTDPVKAVEAYFQKNATDELKARCKAEGKDAEGCWKFIEAVARKALHGSSGHIDPAVVYAIAMHWFEDVPKDWDKAGTKAERSSAIRTEKSAKSAKKESKIEKLERKVAQGQSEPARQKAKEELRKAKDAKKRKAKNRQGFFFEMLETPAEGGRGDESPRTEQESEVVG